MKRLLTCLGALSLTVASVSVVVACGNTNKNKVTPPSTETKEIATIRAESLLQVKAYVLADAYGLDLKKTINTVDYAFDQTKSYFNADTLPSANLNGMDLTGTRGSDAQFLIQLIEKINLPIIGNIGEITIPGLGKVSDLLNQSRALIASIPGLLNALPFEQYLSSLPTLLNLVGDQQFLPKDPGMLADGIAATIIALYQSKNFDAILTTLDVASGIDELKDLSLSQLANSFFVSLLTTIGYGLWPTTFTSLTTGNKNDQYNPQALIGANYDQAVQNFFSFVFKKTPSTTEGYHNQPDGFVYYLVKTIKVLEVLISGFDESLNETFTIIDGDYLFNSTIKNTDYLAKTTTKKVSELPLSETGLHLEYLLSKLSYFFNDQNEENGYRLLKLINLLFAPAGYEFPDADQGTTGSGDGSTENFNKEDEGEEIQRFPGLNRMLTNILTPVLGDILGDGVSEVSAMVLKDVVPQMLIPLLMDGIGDPNKVVEGVDEDTRETIEGLIEAGIIPKSVVSFFMWLTSDEAQTLFNHPWTNLYQGDLNNWAAIFGQNLDDFSKKINVEQLNLHTLFNEALVRDLIITFSGKDFDLGSLTDLSVDGLISKVGQNFMISKTTSAEQVGNVLPVKVIQQMLQLFFGRNYIKEGISLRNQSLLRQLITNINHWTKFLPLLGYAASDAQPGLEPSHTYVYGQSLVGQIVYLFSPGLRAKSDPTANDKKGELIDLNTLRVVDPTNHWAVCGGINQTVSDLLTGTDYRTFVTDQANNTTAWVVDKVVSNYDSLHKEILLNQTYELSFLGSDEMHIKGVSARYRVTFARTNASEKFSFKRLVRLTS